MKKCLCLVVSLASLLFFPTAVMAVKTIAMVGASFEMSGSWKSLVAGHEEVSRARVETYFQALMAMEGGILYPINRPGAGSRDILNNARWLFEECQRFGLGYPEYLVIGLTGSVFDPNNTIIPDYTQIVRLYRSRGTKVFVTRFPPYEGGNDYVSLHLDQEYYREWNERFEDAMRKTGAIVVSVYQTWRSSDLPFPPTAPYGDYHLDGPSALRAAVNYYRLITEFDVCLKEMATRPYCASLFSEADLGVLE